MIQAGSKSCMDFSVFKNIDSKNSRISFKKLLYTEFYLLDTSIESIIWSAWKKRRGADPIHP